MCNPSQLCFVLVRPESAPQTWTGLSPVQAQDWQAAWVGAQSRQSPHDAPWGVLQIVEGPEAAHSGVQDSDCPFPGILLQQMVQAPGAKIS